MKRGLAVLAIGAALVTACNPAPQPVANKAEPANAAEPAAPAPVATSAAVTGSPLASWLVGSWSAEANCSSDFIAHYNADGSLQYGEDSGSWTLAGDTVTETVTERFAMESDAPQKLPKPEIRSYTVTKTDDGHGTINFKGRKVSILRC